MPAFLRALSILPDVSSACRVARIGRTTAYEARNGKGTEGQPDHRVPVPGFKEAWDEAERLARDFLDRHLHTWATTGVPVRSSRTVTKTKRAADGTVIETVTDEIVSESAERSATLLIFMLKAWYPDRYRWSEKVEASGPDGGPIQLESISAIDARIAELSAELAAAGLDEPVPVE